MPNEYWINPALFFKGDRVAFVREFHRVRAAEGERLQQKQDSREHFGDP
jgi:hypothetical protein